MSETPSWKRSVERVMNHLYMEVFIALLILASVVLVLVEASLLPTEAAYEKVAYYNDLLTYIFIVELSVRFVIERKKRRFFRRYWVDIIAVMPTLRAFRFLRVLRLLRLFRVGLILSRHLRFFSRGFAFVKIEYVIIVFAIVISILMGALSMRFTEGRDNPSFGSFENAMWFSVMTLVAGEPIGGEPTSRLGRMVALTLMMGGLTIFAIFTGTVSAVMIDSLRNLKFRHMDIDELSNHVVICGWNAAANLVLRELLHASDYKHFVVISERRNLDDLEVANHNEVYFVTADYTRVDVLRDAGVERAKVAILLADDSKDERSLQDRDARTVLAAMLIEKLNDEIYTTVQLLNRDNETSLKRIGVEEIIVSDEYVGNIMASVVRNRGIIAVLDELLTARHGQQFFKCTVPKRLRGMTVADAMAQLKVDHNATLIAVDPDGNPNHILVNPAPDFELTAEHSIIVAASQPLDS